MDLEFYGSQEPLAFAFLGFFLFFAFYFVVREIDSQNGEPQSRAPPREVNNS